MSSNYKPHNYNSVSPYLIVNGAAETIQFLINAFDAEELRRFPDESGRLMHAEVRLDDTVLMLADAVEEWPAIAAQVHIYVPDVDATYRRALDAGAVSIQEPAQRSEDDDKRGGVKDASGITWWIAQAV
ncbi:MAG: VOC family protein [Chloroflexota bacterium]